MPPRRAFVDRQDDGADLDLVALLDANFLDRAGDRRRHLDGRLVGLEFQDRLIAGDGVAHLDHHVHHVAAGDVFAKLRDFEFSHGTMPRRSPDSASPD